jgi:hypothetical protein
MLVENVYLALRSPQMTWEFLMARPFLLFKKKALLDDCSKAVTVSPPITSGDGRDSR